MSRGNCYNHLDSLPTKMPMRGSQRSCKTIRRTCENIALAFRRPITMAGSKFEDFFPIVK